MSTRTSSADAVVAYIGIQFDLPLIRQWQLQRPARVSGHASCRGPRAAAGVAADVPGQNLVDALTRHRGVNEARKWATPPLSSTAELGRGCTAARVALGRGCTAPRAPQCSGRRLSCR